MTYIAVYPVASPQTPNKVLTHFEDIAALLAEHGVRFERWQAAAPLHKGDSEAEWLAAYQPHIDALGFGRVEVISVDSTAADLRAEHLQARRYSEAHARLFIAGQGLFSLHIGDYVYAVRCEKNDLLVIPAGLAHWLDIGEHPHLVAARLFKTQQGLVPQFIGDNSLKGFPGLDD